MQPNIKISVVIPTKKKTDWCIKNEEILKKNSLIKEIIYEIGVYPVGLARQKLLEKAKCDYLLWLDDDVELKKDPIPELIQLLNSKKNIVGACCSTIELDSTYILNELNRRLLTNIYKKRKSHFNCGLFRKQALLEVGGFNKILIGGEDNDIIVKLNKANSEVLGLRDLTVLHHSTRDWKKEQTYFEGYKYLYNTYDYFDAESSQVCSSRFKYWSTFYFLNQTECIKQLTHRIAFKSKHILKLPYLLIKNLLMELFPESFKPIECGLLITENCIFKCKSCTYWKEKKEDIALKNIYKIVDCLVSFGIKRIILVGGEPLLRTDLMQIIRYIKSQNLQCGIISNGYLGANKRDELLLLDNITVSIDGLKKTHEYLRGVPCWDRAIDLIFELKKKYNKNVSVNFVIQKNNYLDLGTILDFFKGLNVPVSILCYHAGGMGQPSAEQNYKKEVEYILKNNYDNLQFEQRKYLKSVLSTFGIQKSQKCIGPNNKFMINGNGDFYICSAWNKPIGNILETNLNSIWNSYKYLRKLIRQGKCEYCINCRSCELTTKYILGKWFIYGYFKKINDFLLRRWEK